MGIGVISIMRSVVGRNSGEMSGAIKGLMGCQAGWFCRDIKAFPTLLFTKTHSVDIINQSFNCAV